MLCFIVYLFVFSFINEGIPFLKQPANFSDVNIDVCGIKMAGCVQDECACSFRQRKPYILGANFCYLSLNSIVERHYLTCYGTKTSLQAQFFAFY